MSEDRRTEEKYKIVRKLYETIIKVERQYNGRDLSSVDGMFDKFISDYSKERVRAILGYFGGGKKNFYSEAEKYCDNLKKENYHVNFIRKLKGDKKGPLSDFYNIVSQQLEVETILYMSRFGFNLIDKQQPSEGADFLLKKGNKKYTVECTCIDLPAPSDEKLKIPQATAEQMDISRNMQMIKYCDKDIQQMQFQSYGRIKDKTKNQLKPAGNSIIVVLSLYNQRYFDMGYDDDKVLGIVSNTRGEFLDIETGLFGLLPGDAIKTKTTGASVATGLFENYNFISALVVCNHRPRNQRDNRGYGHHLSGKSAIIANPLAKYPIDINDFAFLREIKVKV